MGMLLSGCISWGFKFLSAVFQSYQDDGIQTESPIGFEPETPDPKSGALFAGVVSVINTAGASSFFLQAISLSCFSIPGYSFGTFY